MASTPCRRPIRLLLCVLEGCHSRFCFGRVGLSARPAGVEHGHRVRSTYLVDRLAGASSSWPSRSCHDGSAASFYSRISIVSW